MKRAVFTLWLLLTAVAATAQGNSPDFEFGYSDLQRLSPDDYISLQLPPLHQLLETRATRRRWSITTKPSRYRSAN